LPSYDITRKPTFQTVKNWVKELKSLGPENIVIAIAGNKADLTDNRAVETAAAAEYAREIGAIFMETSAKSAENVHDIFTRISECLPKEGAGAGGGKAQASITIISTPEKKKKGCC
jgi:GTPase SAR1 family protein